jgi:hypothetical protein
LLSFFEELELSESFEVSLDEAWLESPESKWSDAYSCKFLSYKTIAESSSKGLGLFEFSAASFINLMLYSCSTIPEYTNMSFMLTSYWSSG